MDKEFIFIKYLSLDKSNIEKGKIKIGNPISNDSEGGEGRVFCVELIDKYEKNELAAKIFHQDYIEKNKDKEDKIKEMLCISLKCDIPSNVCWPFALIYKNDKFVGYLMKKAKGISLSKFMRGPTTQNEFPNYSDVEYSQICLSIMNTIEKLHYYDIMIGDINEDNFIIGDSQTVFLIDTDSFQFGKFKCKVGRENYFSPTYYENGILDEDSEGYSICILIFKILMLGRDPFTSLLKVESKKERVTKGMFPYNIRDDITKKLINRPLYVNLWKRLSIDLKLYFINVFSRVESYNGSFEIINILEDFLNESIEKNKNLILNNDFKSKDISTQDNIDTLVINSIKEINKTEENNNETLITEVERCEIKNNENDDLLQNLNVLNEVNCIPIGKTNINDEYTKSSLPSVNADEKIAKIGSNKELIDKNYEMLNVKVGDKLVFGNYGNESIEWQVLEIKDNKALILTDKVIDVIRFGARTHNYGASEIRKWLNNNFINQTFSNDERDIILNFRVYGDDRIFLLSSEEVYKRFKTLSDRTAKVTPYVKNKIKLKEQINYRYWLRSVKRKTRKRTGHKYILVNSIDNNGLMCSVHGTNAYGVRPACWINLKTKELNNIIKSKETLEKDYKLISNESDKKVENSLIESGQNLDSLNKLNSISIDITNTREENNESSFTNIVIDEGITNINVNNKVIDNNQKLLNIKVGDKLVFGNYANEPIEWRVLKLKDNKALILTDKVIDVMRFDPQSNDYEKSEIRNWLNNDFISSAFSIKEKSCIEIKIVDNNSFSFSNNTKRYTSKNTQDYFFLLAFNESFIDFRSMDILLAKPTIYAANRGAIMYNGYAYYWLRPPYYDSNKTAFAVTGGGGYGYYEISSSNIGIRPACWLKLENAPSNVISILSDSLYKKDNSISTKDDRNQTINMEELEVKHDNIVIEKIKDKHNFGEYKNARIEGLKKLGLQKLKQYNSNIEYYDEVIKRGYLLKGDLTTIHLDLKQYFKDLKEICKSKRFVKSGFPGSSYASELKDIYFLNSHIKKHKEALIDICFDTAIVCDMKELKNEKNNYYLFVLCVDLLERIEVFINNKR